MPQLTLPKLKQAIQGLKPNSQLDYLRQQIANRDVLRAEVRQLVIERDLRKEKVRLGELPVYAVFEVEGQISARQNTMNVDYETQSVNCLILSDPAAQLINNMLNYDEREASTPAAKAREEFRKMRPLMESGIRQREEAIRRDGNIIRSGPWEPDSPHERRRREMAKELENFKATSEREIKNAEIELRKLSAAEMEAKQNIEFFRHWVFTGSLEGPPAAKLLQATA